MEKDGSKRWSRNGVPRPSLSMLLASGTVRRRSQGEFGSSPQGASPAKSEVFNTAKTSSEDEVASALVGLCPGRRSQMAMLPTTEVLTQGKGIGQFLNAECTSLSDAVGAPSEGARQRRVVKLGRRSSAVSAPTDGDSSDAMRHVGSVDPKEGVMAALGVVELLAEVPPVGISANSSTHGRGAGTCLSTECSTGTSDCGRQRRVAKLGRRSKGEFTAADGDSSESVSMRAVGAREPKVGPMDAPGIVGMLAEVPLVGVSTKERWFADELGAFTVLNRARLAPSLPERTPFSIGAPSGEASPAAGASPPRGASPSPRAPPPPGASALLPLRSAEERTHDVSLIGNDAGRDRPLSCACAGGCDGGATTARSSVTHDGTGMFVPSRTQGRNVTQRRDRHGHEPCAGMELVVETWTDRAPSITLGEKPILSYEAQGGGGESDRRVFSDSGPAIRETSVSEASDQGCEIDACNSLSSSHSNGVEGTAEEDTNAISAELTLNVSDLPSNVASNAPSNARTPPERPVNGIVCEQSISESLKGSELLLTFLCTWGDRNYFGLTGLQVLDRRGVPFRLGVSNMTPSPASVNELCGGVGDDPRTVDKVLDGVNVTTDSTHMWLAPWQEGRESGHTLIISLGPEGIDRGVSGITFWNYNKGHEDSDRGVRAVRVTLDHCLVSPLSGLLLQKAPGHAHFDFGQTFMLTKGHATPRAAEEQREGIAKAVVRMVPLEQHYFAPVLPSGLSWCFRFLSSWSDPHHMGLDAMQLFDDQGVSLCHTVVRAYAIVPSCVTSTTSVHQNFQSVDQLFLPLVVDEIRNGVPPLPPTTAREPSDVWLAPWTPETVNEVWLSFNAPVRLAVFRALNWSLDPAQGVKEFELLADGLLVYRGELACAGELAPSAHGEPRPLQGWQSVLFTEHELVLSQERPYSMHVGAQACSHVALTNDGVCVGG